MFVPRPCRKKSPSRALYGFVPQDVYKRQVQALYAEAGALIIATSQGVYRYDEAGLSSLYDQSGLLHFQRLADSRLAFQAGGQVVLLDWAADI